MLLASLQLVPQRSPESVAGPTLLKGVSSGGEEVVVEVELVIWTAYDVVHQSWLYLDCVTTPLNIISCPMSICTQCPTTDD